MRGGFCSPGVTEGVSKLEIGPIVYKRVNPQANRIQEPFRLPPPAARACPPPSQTLEREDGARRADSYCALWGRPQGLAPVLLHCSGRATGPSCHCTGDHSPQLPLLLQMMSASDTGARAKPSHVIGGQLSRRPWLRVALLETVRGRLQRRPGCTQLPCFSKFSLTEPQDLHGSPRELCRFPSAM